MAAFFFLFLFCLVHNWLRRAEKKKSDPLYVGGYKNLLVKELAKFAFVRFLPNALVYTRLVGFLWLNALLASTCFSLEFNYTAFPFRALTKLRKKEGDERKRFEMSIFVPVFDSKQSCCDGNPKDGNEVVGKRKRRRRKKRRSKLPLPPNYNSPQGGLFLITLITIKER